MLWMLYGRYSLCWLGKTEILYLILFYEHGTSSWSDDDGVVRVRGQYYQEPTTKSGRSLSVYFSFRFTGSMENGESWLLLTSCAIVWRLSSLALHFLVLALFFSTFLCIFIFMWDTRHWKKSFLAIFNIHYHLLHILSSFALYIRW